VFGDLRHGTKNFEVEVVSVLPHVEVVSVLPQRACRAMVNPQCLELK
jgi:hypothetical protein